MTTHDVVIRLEARAHYRAHGGVRHRSEVELFIYRLHHLAYDIYSRMKGAPHPEDPATEDAIEAGAELAAQLHGLTHR